MRIILLTGMYPNSANPLNGGVVKAQREALESIGIHTDLVHIKPKKRTEFINSIRYLRRMIKNSVYDLLHVHYGFSALAISLFQPLPVVITFHGSDINGVPLHFNNNSNLLNSFIFSFISLINRQLSRSAKAVIVMSHEMKSRLPLSVQSKTWVEPMGVDTSLFFQHPKQAARKKLGWGDEPVAVFCNNNNEPVKRQDLAEKAIAHARRCAPSLRLFILKGMNRDDVPLVLSASDCLLVTSDKEGFPNIVRESLACNLPIISVPVGDLQALISENPSSGVLVPQKPEAIAEAILNILKKKRPDNSALFNQGFSLADNALRIKGIYEYVIRKS